MTHLKAFSVGAVFTSTKSTVKKDTQKIKSVMDNLMKRTLMTLGSTPMEPLYAEMGMIEIGLLLTKNRINYSEKIEKHQSTSLKTIREDPDIKGWWKNNQKTRDGLIGVTTSDNMDKESLKTKVKKATIKKQSSCMT